MQKTMNLAMAQSFYPPQMCTAHCVPCSIPKIVVPGNRRRVTMRLPEMEMIYIC